MRLTITEEFIFPSPSVNHCEFGLILSSNSCLLSPGLALIPTMKSGEGTLTTIRGQT